VCVCVCVCVVAHLHVAVYFQNGYCMLDCMFHGSGCVCMAVACAFSWWLRIHR
jgi:hypothetical protein